MNQYSIVRLILKQSEIFDCEIVLPQNGSLRQASRTHGGRATDNSKGVVKLCLYNGSHLVIVSQAHSHHGRIRRFALRLGPGALVLVPPHSLRPE